MLPWPAPEATPGYSTEKARSLQGGDRPVVVRRGLERRGDLCGAPGAGLSRRAQGYKNFTAIRTVTFLSAVKLDFSRNNALEIKKAFKQQCNFDTTKTAVVNRNA